MRVAFTVSTPGRGRFESSITWIGRFLCLCACSRSGCGRTEPLATHVAKHHSVSQSPSRNTSSSTTRRHFVTSTMRREETVPKKSEKNQRRRAVTGRLRWPPSRTRVKQLIAEAIVDAYDDSEQRIGFLTMLEEFLDLPFETDILGVRVTVERIDHNDAEEVVAI